MFKVKVFTMGRCKESWLAAALAEYEKRLTGRLTLEWHLAKNDAQLEEWALLGPFIALDPQGELLTSEEWSRKMGHFGARCTFVIGGANGLSPLLLQKAQFRWSLSRLTFTHQMARLILIEQLYRAIEIKKGSQYHK